MFPKMVAPAVVIDRLHLSIRCKYLSLSSVSEELVVSIDRYSILQQVSDEQHRSASTLLGYRLLYMF